MVQTAILAGKTVALKIVPDNDCRSPREDDEGILGTMVYTSSDYVLGDKRISDPIEFLIDILGYSYDTYSEYLSSKFERASDILAYLEDKFEKKFVVHKLYLYDHSGITMSTSPFSCRWDSGQVGYIYASLERYNELTCNKHKRLTKTLRNKILEELKGEVKTFDDHLTGSVYGFEINEVDEDGDELNFIDSCYGFYGDEWFKNGMSDYVPDELHQLLKDVEITYSNS